MAALLVEDDPAQVRLIHALLREEASQDMPIRVRLDAAGTVAEGLARLAAGGVDVVLLDLNLPDSRGIQTLRKVAGAHPDVPVVVLTSMDEEAVALGAVRAGAQDYLVKGAVDGPGLVRALGHARERHRILRELRQRDRILEETLREAPALVLTLDLQGVCTSSEGKALATLGRWAPTPGTSALELYGFDHAFVDSLRAALQGHPGTGVVSLDGRVFEFRFAPTRDAAGDPAGAVAVAAEVTALVAQGPAPGAGAAPEATGPPGAARPAVPDAGAGGPPRRVAAGGTAASTGEASNAGEGRPRPASGATLRVLVVEDQPQDADLLRRSLDGTSGSRCVIHLEPTLQGAMAWARAHAPDVVLLDLGLPDSPPAATLPKFLAEFQDIPVVVLTVHDDQEMAQQAVRLGAQDYLVKGRFAGDALHRAMRYAVDRHALVEGLQRREAAVTSTLAGLPVALLALDGSGLLTLCQGRSLEVLGLTRGSVGRPADEAFRGQPDLLALVRRALAGEDVVATVHPGGSGQVIEVHGSPVLDRAGAVAGATVVAADVSRRHRAERERLAAQARMAELQRLLEVDRERTRFINVAAHELNTPLTPLRLEVDLLRRLHASEMPPDALDSLDIIDRSVSRLASLVEDLLTAARLPSGTLRFERRAVRLHAALAEAAGVYARQAAAKDIALAAPDPAAGPEVLVDPARLHQVVANLLSNAVKFTPPGGRVALEVATQPGFAEVLVRDTGAGFRPEDVPNLFRPFSRLHGATLPGVAGTGLGLYIAKGIVSQWGGVLRGASGGPGQGACFAFTVPLASA